MSDGELVRQALAGRAEAYGELVRRWAGRVTALCHAKTGCGAAADDLAQEALLRGYRSLGSLAEPDKFGPWLCRIAARLCLDWYRARGRAHVPFSALDAAVNPEAYLQRQAEPEGAAADRDEELRRLREEVEALPAEYREVVKLYYHQKVTYRELADMLDVSAATINARLTKARGMLRERLSRCRS